MKDGHAETTTQDINGRSIAELNAIIAQAKAQKELMYDAELQRLVEGAVYPVGTPSLQELAADALHAEPAVWARLLKHISNSLPDSDSQDRAIREVLHFAHGAGRIAYSTGFATRLRELEHEWTQAAIRCRPQ